MLGKFIYSVFLMNIYACANNLQHSVVDKEGFRTSVYVDKNNLKQGEQTVLHPDDYTIEISNYKDGELDGQRILFYPDGSPELIEEYANGIFHGPYKSYFENGSKKYEATYVENVMTGIYLAYFPSGKIKESITFADNEENGPFIEYFENGHKKWEGTYVNGDNEVGLLHEYNEQGILIKKMMCDEESICTTIWSIDKYENEK